MSDLFKATHCDRCGKELVSRWLSMFNMDVICPECKEKERQRSDYNQAIDAVDAEFKKGTIDFEGVGYKEVN